jgi:hypothetical protein
MEQVLREPGDAGPEGGTRPNRTVQVASRPPEPPGGRAAAVDAGESAGVGGTIWHSYAREAGDGDLAELSDSEAAVFRVLSDPRFVTATAQERADAAGISRRTYFRVLADPHFEPRFRAAWRRCLRAHVGPVLSALVASASTPEARHANDRKLFLGLVGLGEGAQEELAKPDDRRAGMTDAELLKAFIDLQIPFPEGIRRRLTLAGLLPPRHDGSAEAREPMPANPPQQVLHHAVLDERADDAEP